MTVVTGALSIKVDAIGASGKASADFVDSNKFKDSDINYLIQVKVVNQNHNPIDLTEFNSIKNVGETDFARVYGDSFISGLVEGGEFNALVSIKLKDKSKKDDISGSLQVKLDLKAWAPLAVCPYQDHCCLWVWQVRAVCQGRLSISQTEASRALMEDLTVHLVQSQIALQEFLGQSGAGHPDLLTGVNKQAMTFQA